MTNKSSLTWLGDISRRLLGDISCGEEKKKTSLSQERADMDDKGVALGGRGSRVCETSQERTNRRLRVVVLLKEGQM